MSIQTKANILSDLREVKKAYIMAFDAYLPVFNEATKLAFESKDCSVLDDIHAELADVKEVQEAFEMNVRDRIEGIKLKDGAFTIPEEASIKPSRIKKFHKAVTKAKAKKREERRSAQATELARVKQPEDLQEAMRVAMYGVINKYASMPKMTKATKELLSQWNEFYAQEFEQD